MPQAPLPPIVQNPATVVPPASVIVPNQAGASFAPRLATTNDDTTQVSAVSQATSISGRRITEPLYDRFGRQVN